MPPKAPNSASDTPRSLRRSQGAGQASGPARYGARRLSFEADRGFTPAAESGLDAADLRIIDVLWENGRANNRSMTDRVGLTEETVAARIRQMIERDVLAVTVIFDWKAAGYNVELWLRIRCAGNADAVATRLAETDEVVHLWVVLGSVDLIAHVLLRDHEAALDFVSGRLPNIRGITYVDVLVGLDSVKDFQQFAALPITPGSVALPDPLIALDELDSLIIKSLMANGRASNREIGRTVGVSDGTVRIRIRRLEDAGLIRVSAQVSTRNSGMFAARSLVALSVAGSDARDVAQELAKLKEVALVSLVSGEHAIMAVVGSSSHDRLIETISKSIRSIPGVGRMETYHILEGRKSTSHWARW